jgi:hypothetical protein
MQLDFGADGTSHPSPLSKTSKLDELFAGERELEAGARDSDGSSPREGFF